MLLLAISGCSTTTLVKCQIDIINVQDIALQTKPAGKVSNDTLGKDFHDLQVEVIEDNKRKYGVREQIKVCMGQ